MNVPWRAMATSFAAAIVVLALVDPAFAQPRATKPPGAQTSAADSLAAQPARPPLWLQNLKSWLQAVSEHTPGQADLPAKRVGSTSDADLDAVRIDLLVLLDNHARAIDRGASGLRGAYKGVSFTPSSIEKLLGLTREEAARADANRILKRGAILHTDVAMLVVPQMPAQVGCVPAIVSVGDGERIGASCSVIHWAQGRALLDAIKPDPRKDPMVRLWYDATTAYLLEGGDHANGASQVDRGSVLFPTDPELLFMYGFHHETLASPFVQQVPRAGVRSASEHLEAAERLFRRALESDPDFVEARIRHGAVLGALGRHAEAARELRKAAASAQTPVLRYYAAMFLGDEEQALGAKDEALSHYNEAAALYPSAQSPRIALGALMRRSGDRAGALTAMRFVLNPLAIYRDRKDPWWSYLRLDHNARMLLRDLYRPFLVGGQQ